MWTGDKKKVTFKIKTIPLRYFRFLTSAENFNFSNLLYITFAYIFNMIESVLLFHSKTKGII